MTPEFLARELHKTYRAAFKALHSGRNKPGHIGLPKNCINEHDHGWNNCPKKAYFRRRAVAILAGYKKQTTRNFIADVFQVPARLLGEA